MGNVLTPPIFKVAPSATDNVPPATVVPLFAVNVERSKVPEETTIFPVADVVEISTVKLPPSVFVNAPLTVSVEYVYVLLMV